MNKFETPLLTQVGQIENVVLSKIDPSSLDDSNGSQPSTTSISLLDVD